MKEKYNLNFHETFKPDTRYISAILGIESFDFLTLKEISYLTGIPTGEKSGKVLPHILYSKYMGFINCEKVNDRYKISKTSLGKVVFKEDICLQEKITLLLCHCMLCRPTFGAEMWSEAFRNIFPKYRLSISKDNLLLEFNGKYNGKANKKNIAPFLNSYNDIFLRLKLLSINDNDVNILAHSYSDEFIYLYGYILYILWDYLYPRQDEITSNDFVNLKYGSIFNLNEISTYNILESLNEKNIIRLNRQLMPYTILRLTNTKSLEEKLYKDLC